MNRLHEERGGSGRRDHTIKIIVSEAAHEASNVVDVILRDHKGNWPGPDFFEREHDGVWNALTAGGWLDLGLAEAEGGAGFHLIELASVAEAWGRHLVPLPFIPTMLIHRWCRGNSSALTRAPLTFALAHASGGLAPFLGAHGTLCVSDLSPLGCMDAMNAAAKCDGWAPSLPIGLVIAPTRGLVDASLAELVILGAAELVGCGAVVLERSVEYARDRVQFGRSIAEYQAVQHRIANMHRDLEAARSALLWAANEPDRACRAAAVAWNCVRAMTENCIQVHGGFGFTWEAGLHYYVRHVWAWAELMKASCVRLWPA